MERDAEGMPDRDAVMRRLNVLWLKLEAEGMYVGANTVALAQELIQHLAAQLFLAQQGGQVSATQDENTG